MHASMNRSTHTKPLASICLAVIITALSVGCAETVRRSDGYANRCFYAATIAAEVKPLEGDSLGICDNALMTISLSRRDQAATYTNRGIVRLNQSAFGRA